MQRKKSPSSRASPRSSTRKKKPSQPGKSPTSKDSKTAAIKPSSNKSGKTAEFSLKSLEAASLGTKVFAVALHPKTGKRLSKRSGKLVVYGIQSAKAKIQRISMEPQAFAQKDLRDLSALLQRSASAQAPGKTLRLTFFQERTDEVLKTKTGRERKKVVKAGPHRGQRVPIYKTKITFVRPKKSVKWRTLLYEDGHFQRALQPYFQKRSAYEEIKAEVLSKIGFTSFEEQTKRFLLGYSTGSVRLTGKTLTSALRHIQPPVSNLWLKKNKVILKFFRKNRVGNIHVDGNVHVTVGGKAEAPISVRIVVRYMGDLAGEIGRAIRASLADKGATYTNPIELARIEARVEKKYRRTKGGLKSKKASEELRRLTEPGRGPKAPKLLLSLRKIQAGKRFDFPLAKTDSVVVNLNFRFYRDISVGETKRKRKRKK